MLHLLLRLLAGLLATPRRLRGWRRGRETRGAYQTLLEGLKALEERAWGPAEKRLGRAAAELEVPLVPWLGAARAAHGRGDVVARDGYLELASREAPGAELAVGLARAELQLADGEREAARATLEGLLAAEPRNRQVLGLLAPLYRDLADWPALWKLLAPLRKEGVVAPAELEDLEDATCLGLLAQAATGGQAALQEQWDRIPRAAQARPRLVAAFCDHLIAAGAQEQAEALLRKALQRDWDRLLIERYGLAVGRDPATQLAWAERFLGDHPDDPKLLLTLGRLCLANRLWGKARTYLEASLGADPRPEVCQELGRLLEELGEAEAALACYRRGLTRATGIARNDDAKPPGGRRPQSDASVVTEGAATPKRRNRSPRLPQPRSLPAG